MSRLCAWCRSPYHHEHLHALTRYWAYGGKKPRTPKALRASRFKDAYVKCMCGENVLVTAAEQEEVYKRAIASLKRKAKEKCRGK
jgi:hypothetical protein